MRPVVALTMGDPAGIGPEVIWGALDDPAVYAHCRPLVVADPAAMERAARASGRAAARLREVGSVAEAAFLPGTLDCLPAGRGCGPLPPFGAVDARAGEAAFRCLARAVDLALAGEVDAVCTAPLHKEALRRAGHPEPGHTEILQRLTGSGPVAMMLVAGPLRVVHVSTHVGLAAAIRTLSAQRVLEALRLGHAALARPGGPAPRVGVCGLNPHAGEHGLFGDGEEERHIAPAVAAARAEGIDAQGPLPADTLFLRAARGAYDLVVAMYHDQGHIPVKLLGFESGVNVTLGLPLVRTSPDHGTALDIAGTGRADPSGMRAAILEAARLAERRRGRA